MVDIATIEVTVTVLVVTSVVPTIVRAVVESSDGFIAPNSIGTFELMACSCLYSSGL